MLKKIKWFIWHIAHWAVLYFAFVPQIEGALHLMKFMVWGSSFLSLFMLSKTTIEASAKNPRTPILNEFSNLQSWVTLGVLVWFGHFYTASAWAVAMVMVAGHRAEVRKLLEEKHK